MATAKLKQFPARLHVTRELDGDETYFQAHETLVDAAEKYETIEVAVYTLVKVEKVRLLPEVVTKD